ncbi:NlpC/P60 family protein [Paenibacillus chondroitinus]|uniref:NlpC/P60 family protein n=1 Tax=Paenibacillus chondroitinus TaxID=59842 RepID=A0ABU6DGI6_9BACL|nr:MULTISPECIES: C40 family peptidase [Paenibacillus]MCY9659448.1 NlpC/P60 family protein [Paenibacillus anseongense]MEB4796843.1 NlpC/P60 family protein [Paenibacillus chondroitinus]
MLKIMRYFTLTTLVTALLFTQACGNSNKLQGIDQSKAPNSPIRSLGFDKDDARISLLQQNGIKYIPMQEFIKTLGFQSSWNTETKTLSIGEIDVVYKLTINSIQAEKEENPVKLSSPPIEVQGNMYAPVADVMSMFSEDMHSKLEDNTLILHGTNLALGMEGLDDDDQVNSQGAVNFFEDDPNDPFRETAPTLGSNISGANDVLTVAAMKNINISALISEARKYMGVRYVFGAGPYPQTKVFDCSSYTQYVFGKFGVNLNRTARAQAQQGTTVSRNSLRTGDLLFFYVPGRFKSNRTVGHVGIYIGNGQMINTFSDKQGVHITTVNKGYWSKKFIIAKRVAN